MLNNKGGRQDSCAILTAVPFCEITVWNVSFIFLLGHWSVFYWSQWNCFFALKKICNISLEIFKGTAYTSEMRKRAFRQVQRGKAN